MNKDLFIIQRNEMKTKRKNLGNKEIQIKKIK